MTAIWSDESKLARWLDVELAALEGWAEVGAVPPEAVREIRERAAPPSPARVAELEARLHHDTAAFVDAVSEQLGPAGRWFHYGLTSSDVVDTALALQIQEAGALILAGIELAFAAVVARAEEHRLTLCIGRTHGVHAEPTTFGLKLAVWAFELDRARTRVVRALEGMRVGKLSGAVGQYAAIDPEVERLACERLGLEPAAASTQCPSNSGLRAAGSTTASRRRTSSTPRSRSRSRRPARSSSPMSSARSRPSSPARKSTGSRSASGGPTASTPSRRRSD